MADIRIDEKVAKGSYREKIITVDNIPVLGDHTGKLFLDRLEWAIGECRQLIEEEGFRLVDFWSDRDSGLHFILRRLEKK